MAQAVVQRYPHAGRVGMCIQELREQRGLSVRGLAKQANMPHTNLLKVESGEMNTPIETLARIAGALNVPLERLLQSATQETEESSRHPREMKDPRIILNELNSVMKKATTLTEQLQPFQGLRPGTFLTMCETVPA